MVKLLHVGAAACATLACILFIVGVASSAWMVGCFSYDNIFKAMKNLPGMEKNLPANFNESAAALSGLEMCVHLGLFKLTMKAGNLVDISFGTDITGMPLGVLIAVAGIIVSIFCGVVGAIFLLLAAGGTTESYENKATVVSRTRAGMILLVIAGVAGIIGMAAYAGGTASAVHSPIMFMAMTGQAASGSLQGMMGQGQGIGRGKRDVSLGGISSDLQQYINTMVEGMDPNYGYAFILGWIAVIFILLAAVLAAVARKSILSRSYDGPASSMKL